MVPSNDGLTRRAVVVAGATAAITVASVAHSARPSNEALVRAFFARQAVSYDALQQAYGDMFAPDIVLMLSGLPEIRGRSAALALIGGFGASGIATIKVDIHRIASNEDTVFTERTDIMRRADGTSIHSVTVAGVMTLKNGKIVRWADYYDPRATLAAFEPKLGG